MEKKDNMLRLGPPGIGVSSGFGYYPATELLQYTEVRPKSLCTLQINDVIYIGLYNYINTDRILILLLLIDLSS